MMPGGGRRGEVADMDGIERATEDPQPLHHGVGVYEKNYV
jgi:hypothetical protein